MVGGTRAVLNSRAITDSRFQSVEQVSEKSRSGLVLDILVALFLITLLLLTLLTVMCSLDCNIGEFLAVVLARIGGLPRSLGRNTLAL